MKRFLLFFGMGLFSFVAFAHADLTITNVSDKIQNMSETVSIPPLGDLEFIKAKFCDQGKIEDREDLILRPGQTKDVCIVFFNTASSGKVVKVLSQFSQGILQANGIPNCSNEYASGTFYGLLSKIGSGYFNLSLAPGEKIIKHIRISVPKTMTGDAHTYGCMVYQLDQKKPDNYSGLFYVVNAKALHFYLTIGGPVYQWQIIDAMNLFRLDNKMVILEIFAGVLVIVLIYSLRRSLKDAKKIKQPHKK